MKRSIWKAFSYVLAALAGGVLTLAVLVFASARTPFGKLLYLDRLIDACFIGEYAETDLADGAAAGMVAGTGDRWSYYIPAAKFSNYQEQMANAYVGVGITVIAREQGGFTVTEILPGSPAESAGVQLDDVVVAVDGQSCMEMSMDEVAALVGGEEGSAVMLTVLRQNQEHELTMTRSRFETEVATGTMLPDSIGLVSIANFDGRCASETLAVIEDLLGQGAEALIFDVRNNPGGYKTELVQVLDYLLPEGDLFVSEDFRGNREVDTSDAACLKLPMAVLVNENTYSAAEFFAAALSEYEAATVVGTQTSGKGYFQNTFSLPDGSAVALSIGRYFTPKGVSLADVGVTPDVVVEVEQEVMLGIYRHQIAPKDDPQIIAAISALKSGR